MQPAQHVYEVSELNREIKRILEEKFPFVWISGEISNFRRPTSGHCYFTLRDSRSQVSCVMFRNQATSLKFKLEDGLQVIGLGRIGLYEPRGTYQLIFEYIDPKGIGALQIAFDKLKKKLFEEGLFDDQHKKPFPFLPGKVTVITSPTGAAVRDFVKVAQRRFPGLIIEIVGVLVQGPRAAAEIISALDHVNRNCNTDLIVLARGGGSIEDLAVFNDERLARAIFSSRVPVVSAVGHETDFTIADFVADLRAPTPSAAAERVIPIQSELQEQVQSYQEKLATHVHNYLKTKRKDLDAVVLRFVHPKRRIEDVRLRMDELCQRLENSVLSILQRKKERCHHSRSLLTSFSPLKSVERNHKELEGATYLLKTRMKQILKERRFALDSHRSRLGSLSPLSILKRGYSITRKIGDAEILRDADQVALEESVEILLGHGQLKATVYDKRST